MASRAVAPGPRPVRGRSDASGRASAWRLRFPGPCYARRNWETRFGAFLQRASQVYDAGTEKGTSFSPDNEAEDPHMPISMIMCDSMAFCEAGEDIKPVAKITVTMM